MPYDIKVDNSGDIDLSSGGLELVGGAAQIRQAIQIGLSTDQGEWFENTLAGIPWTKVILSQRGTQGFMDAFIVNYLYTTFNKIDEVTTYSSYIDSNYKANISFSATLLDGSTLSLDVGV